ncbi:armadillo-type protein [Boletus reticuloceps]|uniref:Selenoprotein O n=1 Tax=Boletus reticuloceps TaxID=495285 RepID=A0A8I3AEJ1_9AGAM|nr:armadillo-type protein [Boletus reticuloceps]
MPLEFPYQVPPIPPSETDTVDKAAYIEKWLRAHEATIPAETSPSPNGLTKWVSQVRDEKRVLVGLSETCLRDCLPHLDIGDAFAVLGRPALVQSSSDSNLEAAGEAGEEARVGDFGQDAETSPAARVRQELVDVLSGHAVLMSVDGQGYAPWSLRYSGHQFGSWAGQLGDGRAISIVSTPHPVERDQEQHLLVKVINRVLYKLDDLVRPYVHKILVVIERLLIDKDCYTRIEGGEYVRNTAAPHSPSSPLPLAVCRSKKSWQACHTGIQIVLQIAIMMGYISAKVRQQAADLTTRLAVVIKQCGEDQLLSKLGLVLFEQLGEEYPDTLGSVIAAEGAITNVVGMTQMNPPVKDLLPQMTPILRNRHEKVQEASINLIGRITDRGAEFVPAREWMRICFELLDLLKAHKKVIRRAAVNSFGYIAKSLGPQDVLSVLLTNLRVQECQSRVCSTVAIPIVAETCGPFTCIPAILNEYRTAELNVRTGCLKALTFVFEYVGPQSAYYVDSVVTMLEDALTDRDLVHRQTAMSS